MKPDITIQQFIELYGDRDSVEWNYDHISRYPNAAAALQWLDAKAKASHCATQELIWVCRYEESLNEADASQADEWGRLSMEWRNVASHFYSLVYLTNDDGTEPSPVISGGEVLYRDYGKSEDDIPFYV